MRALDVPCDCGAAALKQAYRRQSLRVHPDRCGGGDGDASTGAFQELQHAYDLLRDEGRRAEYDFGSARRETWEAAMRAHYFPDPVFRPFVRPQRHASEWDCVA